MALDEGLSLVETDAGALYDSIIKAAEEAVGEPLYPGDERRIFIEALLPIVIGTRNAIEDAAEQTTLRYARGEVLDALGERVGVTRLPATGAQCTMRFELSGVREQDTTIPKWTHVTADSEIYFATDEEATVKAGSTSVDVPASAPGSGEAGNGYHAGSISTLVDLIPYVAKVSNLEETFGGDDGETYDEAGDARFRERIRLAHEALSVAGPSDAYAYWAKTADPAIVDVAVISDTFADEIECEVVDGRAFVGGDLLRPAQGLTVEGASEGFTYSYEDSLLDIKLGEGDRVKPTVKVSVVRAMDGRVIIVPLMEGGEDPTEDQVAAILQAVNSTEVRPMTDVVSVRKPRDVDYTIDLTYWVTPEAEGAVAEAIEGAGGVIDTYIAQQSAKLGRDVNPDVLKTLVMEAGAIRAEVASPAYAEVDDDAVARLQGRATVTHKVETRARWDDE